MFKRIRYYLIYLLAGSDTIILNTYIQGEDFEVTLGKDFLVCDNIFIKSPKGNETIKEELARSERINDVCQTMSEVQA